MRAGIVHQPLDEHAEEAAQVGVRDEQVERELDGVALNRRHALGPLSLVAQAGELRLKPRDVDVRAAIGLAHRGAGDVCRMAWLDYQACCDRHSPPIVRTMTASSFWPRADCATAA